MAEVISFSNCSFIKLVMILATTEERVKSVRWIMYCERNKLEKQLQMIKDDILDGRIRYEILMYPLPDVPDCSDMTLKGESQFYEFLFGLYKSPLFSKFENWMIFAHDKLQNMPNTRARLSCGIFISAFLKCQNIFCEEAPENTNELVLLLQENYPRLYSLLVPELEAYITRKRKREKDVVRIQKLRRTSYEVSSFAKELEEVNKCSYSWCTNQKYGYSKLFACDHAYCYTCHMKAELQSNCPYRTVNVICGAQRLNVHLDTNRLISNWEKITGAITALKEAGKRIDEESSEIIDRVKKDDEDSKNNG